MEILQERNPQPQGFIFTGESATGHISPPKERWRKLLIRAELEDFTIHDLRRSLGSWQAMAEHAGGVRSVAGVEA